MTTQARFDEVVFKQIEEMLQKVITTPEVRSISIIVDWDLPSHKGLPIQAWRAKESTEPFEASMHMTAQLNRAAVNQSQTTLQILQEIKKAHQADKPAQEEQKAVGNEPGK